MKNGMYDGRTPADTDGRAGQEQAAWVRTINAHFMSLTPQIILMGRLFSGVGMLGAACGQR